jgi:putative toxin-antitoxin system antitoxin component (TIGR02293 family)
MLKGAIMATSAIYSGNVRTARGSKLAAPKPGGGYRELFAASPQARIAMIRQGVPAIEAKRLVQALGVEQKVFYQALGLKTATVNRKITQSEQLASDESERLLGVARLIGQVEAIVADSGDPKGFDAPEWLSRWLREPLPALGGTPPMALLDTMEGQAMVAEALARIQSGAYA